MSANYELDRLLDQLRSVYPGGHVPEHEYWALLAVLYDDVSDRNLSKVITELTGANPMDVDRDIVLAVTKHRADESDVDSVRRRLLAAGWEPDDS